MKSSHNENRLPYAELATTKDGVRSVRDHGTGSKGSNSYKKKGTFALKPSLEKRSTFISPDHGNTSDKTMNMIGPAKISQTSQSKSRSNSCSSNVNGKIGRNSTRGDKGLKNSSKSVGGAS